MYHDAKHDKPKRSGTYIAYSIFHFGDGTDVVYNVANLPYDADKDAWNGDSPMFPDYWSEIPSVEELERGNYN